VVNQGNSEKTVSLKTIIMDANGNQVASDTSSAVNISAGSDYTFNQNLTVSNPIYGLLIPRIFTWFKLK